MCKTCRFTACTTVKQTTTVGWNGIRALDTRSDWERQHLPRHGWSSDTDRVQYQGPCGLCPDLQTKNDFGLRQHHSNLAFPSSMPNPTEQKEHLKTLLDSLHTSHLRMHVVHVQSLNKGSHNVWMWARLDGYWCLGELMGRSDYLEQLKISSPNLLLYSLKINGRPLIARLKSPEDHQWSSAFEATTIPRKALYKNALFSAGMIQDSNIYICCLLLT